MLAEWVMRAFGTALTLSRSHFDLCLQAGIASVAVISASFVWSLLFPWMRHMQEPLSDVVPRFDSRIYWIQPIYTLSPRLSCVFEAVATGILPFCRCELARSVPRVADL
jgi:hypothetical protein